MRALATCTIAAALGCGGGEAPKKPSLTESLNAESEAKQAAAEAKKVEAAKAAEEKRKADEEAEEKAYAEAKAKLEPMAKLPKKRPKGFAKACDEMLPAYAAHMEKTLTGEDLTRWTNNKESRMNVLRRSCRERSVEAVVCQTQLLAKAPDGVHIDHIMRVCAEKF